MICTKENHGAIDARRSVALDRFIFGDWLGATSQPVHLVGASIGAWRMATACLNDPVAAFKPAPVVAAEAPAVAEPIPEPPPEKPKRARKAKKGTTR